MTQLTADDIARLTTGAHFLACCIDPSSLGIYADMITHAIGEHPIDLVSVDDLDPDALVISIGIVTQGPMVAEMLPSGDEFLTCIADIEKRLGRKVAAIYSLAAANVNAIIPLMVGLQSGLPVLDSDGMGRVFPMIFQSTLNAAGLSISPITMMGVTGERATIEAATAFRAEILVRAVVTEMGGWAATAMYPVTAAQMSAHGVHGSISRLIKIGRILDSEGSADAKFVKLVSLLGATRIARARVTHLDSLARQTDRQVPSHAASITLEDESNGRIVRLEIRNEIVLALVDGAVASATPDIITMLSTENAKVLSLEDITVGRVIDILSVPADEKWYTPEGLALSSPQAFYIPVKHPRQA